jgi:hypothetical protein
VTFLTFPSKVVLGSSRVRSPSRFSPTILADLAVRGFPISKVTLASVALPDSFFPFLCTMYRSWCRDGQLAVALRTLALKLADFTWNQYCAKLSRRASWHSSCFAARSRLSPRTPSTPHPVHPMLRVCPSDTNASINSQMMGLRYVESGSGESEPTWRGKIEWCRGAESNCLRRPFQGRALPVSYLGTGMN